MKKEETRPLLVKALERAPELEEVAYQAMKQVAEDNPVEAMTWSPLAQCMEEWDRLRLVRAQAELALWLADREWEREEKARQSVWPTGKT